ncbi:MAG: D-aminoacyl-tRNA deacylase [Gemmatimonas sp.]|jgi:D-tyrosyl-tRNA(Tyr) deacylase|uniref:D-aminoacyl-tRNA deacylase n=1 Tax=Gemmatimonas sp. TaxID=1962908 RepID=UPI00391F4848
MRILLQRVTRAEVRIRGELPDDPVRVSGRIGDGYVLLVGFTHTDTSAELEWMTDKVLGLRLFPDEDQKLNHDLGASGGALLVVSQFTLYADVRKGRRPSFVDAAKPDLAVPLYNQFVRSLRERGMIVETGEFGARMDVELVNDGPVTIWLEREAPSPST